MGAPTVPGVGPRIEIPDELQKRPFRLAEAVSAGLSPDMLRGQRFRRLHREVYVCADVELTLEVRVRAALLILPAGAAATGITTLVSAAWTSGATVGCTSRRPGRTNDASTVSWCIGASVPRRDSC